MILLIIINYITLISINIEQLYSYMIIPNILTIIMIRKYELLTKNITKHYYYYYVFYLNTQDHLIINTFIHLNFHFFLQNLNSKLPNSYDI